MEVYMTELTEPNLMQLFKFSPDDLRANQQGQLSTAQQTRWAEAGQWAGSMTGITIPLVVAITIAVIGIIISLAVSQPMLGIVLSLVIAGLAGIGVRMMLKPDGRSQTPVPVTAVHRAEGIVHLKETFDTSGDGMSRRYYRLEIDHHSFQLFRREQFEALENGGHYIVYYLDDDDQYIVSLEKAN